MSEEIKFHKSAIQWRRDIILQKLSQGYSQSEIARELQLHPSTISLDCQFLRQQSAQNIRSHIEERIPMRYAEVDEGLKLLLRKAWQIINNPNSKTSEVLSAITSITNVYDKWLTISTDERTLDRAVSWIEKKKESLQKEQDQQYQQSELSGSSEDLDGANVYIDMANVEYIEAVKQELGDDTNWQRIHDTLKRYRDMNLRIEDSSMKVIPTSFGQEGASMLTHCKNLLEHEDSIIAINPKHEELITSLRGAVAQEYKLLKSETPYPDLMDAFRLACKYFRLEK